MRFATRKLVVLLVIAAMLWSIVPVGAGTTGIISGVLTDAKTGAKLSGVNVAIKGTGMTTVTDANGYFVITNVAPGTYEVVAGLVGYGDTSKTDVQVMMDATTPCDFKLDKVEIKEKEAIVKGTRKLLQPDVTTTLYMVPSRQERMVKNQPNNLYQVQGIVGTQPGVTLDADGLPHIRGGRQEEIGYMIEGIPVMEPLTNMFGTNTVTVGMSRMQVYTGGYKAEYGNAISGVLNEIKRTGSEVPGGKLEMTGGAQDYKGSYLEYGGVSPSGLDYYVGSYLWQSSFEKMFFSGTESADTVGKFVLPKGNDKYTLLVNQGSARYFLNSIHDFTFQHQPVTPEADHNHQKYSILGLTWSHNFNPASFLTVRPYVFKTSSVVDSLAPDGPMGMYMDYGTRQRGLQVEYTNQLNANHLLKTGTSMTASKNAYMAWIPDLGEAFGQPDWGDYYYNSNVNTLQSGAFIQDEAKLSSRLRGEFGLRYDKMKFNKVENPDVNNSQISPRLGSSYTLNDKNCLKASWGRFIQFAPSYVMERIYANPGWNDYRLGSLDLKPERSVSWDFSWEHQVDSNTLFRLTPFHKTYSDLLQTKRVNPDDPESMTTMYINSGKGKSNGVEAYLSKRLSNNWEGWLSYTYMKARANASSFTSSIDPSVWSYCDWDQRHTFNAVISYKKNVWEHNWQLFYGSGLADTVDIDTVQYQRHGQPATVFSWNITRKLPKGSPLGDQVSLSIWNLFNTGKATHYYSYLYPSNPDDPESAMELGRDADSWIVPRFINLSVQRKF